MKIIAILSLCLTASLSFAHSVILDNTKYDAFTYDYSGLPSMPQRVGKSIAVYSPSWSDFSFVVVGTSEDDEPTQHLNKTKGNAISYDYANIYEVESSPFSLDVLYDTVYGLNIPYQHSDHHLSTNTTWFVTEPNLSLDYAKRVIRKLKSSSHRYGFPSKTDANAYFNIHILNNTPNNQLGYLRWLTYEFSDSIKSYIINFGATTTEHLAPPLFPLYKTPNDTTDNTFTYKYLWLCNDVINCQFIKRFNMCDKSSHIFSSYDIHTTFSDKCKPYNPYLPLELLGFSSKADASINIQLFDSPVLLKDKQNHPTNIKHDF